MLEVQNLVKIYKPKKGVPVKALNNISLKFPETGMVFLLGKSGSGKSTLLNVLGGLDRANSGDILIKGQSTKTFRQRHFDSYRNTYVGFIFQEYNILDDFTVGANIALALQLQGIKPTSEQINDILRQVDLEGYGSRKPNELSGGQKQRVAIARALVKDPRIVMADEPTGALDSETGRQVLTTLKKLSQTRLVMVVSHDREFAELYADRIVELSDGQVIRDVERVAAEAGAEVQSPVYQDDTVYIPEQYVFTPEEEKAVMDYIKSAVNKGQSLQICPSAHAEDAAAFSPTDQSRIKTDQQGYKLIKSKLPLRYAFKLGASGLKHKKFRLVMTILLSCVAFVLFGLADTMASYNYTTTCVSSMTDPDSVIRYAALEKESYRDEGDWGYWEYSPLTKEDRELIEERTGIEFYDIYSPGIDWFNTEFYNNVDSEKAHEYSAYYARGFAGFIEADDDLFEDMHAELAYGQLPEKNGQIAISTYIADTFVEYGYRDHETGETQKIKKPKDMLGKSLLIGEISFTVCGIVDTGADYSRYDSLKEEIDTDDFIEYIAYMALESELRYSVNYTLDGLAVIAPGTLEDVANSLSYMYEEFWMEPYGAVAVDVYSDSWDGKILWQENVSRLSGDEMVISEGIAESIWGYEWREFWEEKTEFYMYYNSKTIGTVNWTATIVGVLEGDFSNTVLLSEKRHAEVAEEEETGISVFQLTGAMPTDYADIEALVKLTAQEIELSDGSRVQYSLMNPVAFELKNLDEIFLVLKDVFFWIGIVFVVFASLLFSNFIGTSISYKKVQIGILRAIGSRSNDVFRIFFAESFIIAMINYVISMVGITAICAVINSTMRYQTGMLLTILNVGVRQFVLLLIVCVGVAAAASFLPVRKIASKRPIDAIRDR